MAWHVITRADNGYPLLVYADEHRAKEVVKGGGEKLKKVFTEEEVETIINKKLDEWQSNIIEKYKPT